MPEITEAIIRETASPSSFSRGKDYYRKGAVTTLSRRGAELYAEVEGSDSEGYSVTVRFGPHEYVEAGCDCPYEGEGWCKHIVAVLLTCVHEPEDVEERPALESLLAPMDRDALQALILNLARRIPELADELELQIAVLRPLSSGQPALQDGAAPPPLLAPELSLVRKKMRAAIKEVANGSNYDSWDDDGYSQLADLEDGVNPFLESADVFIATGDSRTALTILEAVTDELIDGWGRLEDVIGYAGDLFKEVGKVWAEALLTGDLSAEERLDWLAKLGDFRKNDDDSGAEEGLAVAAEAGIQGWGYPPLVRVLRGEVVDGGVWEGKPPACAGDLTEIRLDILERQNRMQEAAHLAMAEGKDDRYLSLLVRLGRANEAVDFGLKRLISPDSALRLARTLRESGETQSALRVAEHGLGLGGVGYDLAIWLRDTAEAAGDTERAIQGAKSAVEESPRLEDYKSLKKLAGERWPRLKEEALAGLRKPGHHDLTGSVDIFLHEGLMQDALNAVRKSYNYDLVARVVEAATPTLPLKVIPLCIDQAATIMDGGKADRYHHAARWVERARDAYRAAGQEANWQSLKEALLETHHRKYKLIPMLRDL